MNLKINFILLFSLVIAHFFGNHTITINIYENYYVIHLMELIVALLMILTSVFLVKNILAKIKKTA